MNIIYSSDSIKDWTGDLICANTIFLAGPTPRTAEVKSWRPDAIAILNQLGFEGNVLVPERRDWNVQFDYVDQTEWESEGLTRCGVILFWIPRDLETMPAFTTNVEFGRFVGQYKIIEEKVSCGFPVPVPFRKKYVGPMYNVVYGRPNDAPKNGYLDWLYTKFYGTQPLVTLEETLAEAVRRIKNQ